jgi:hypothetical protein
LIIKIAFAWHSLYLMSNDTAVDLCCAATASSMSKVTAASGEKSHIAARIREAGERARAEAETRRATENPPVAPRELGGTEGPEPTRYGDWERKGIVSDF